MHGGYSTVHVNHIVMHLKDHKIKITINIKNSNNPDKTDFSVSSKDKEKFRPKLWSALDHYVPHSE